MLRVSRYALLPLVSGFAIFLAAAALTAASEKVAFYKNLCEELEQACGISPSDVVVTISDISDDGTATAEIDNAALEKES